MNVTDLIRTFDSLDANTPEPSEYQLLDRTLRAARIRLETPRETCLRLVFGEPGLYATLLTTINFGLWQQWVAAGGGPMSSLELATMVDCIEALLGCQT